LAEIWEWLVEAYKKAQDDQSLAQPSVILSALDYVIGHKSKRFADVFTQLPSVPNAEQIFHAITNPEAQIKQLNHRLHLTFVEFLGDKDLRTVLVSMEDGKPVKFIDYQPEGHHPGTQLLGEEGRKSFFAAVYRARKSLVIPDIKKELKKKKDSLFFDPEGLTEGSIAGIPVKHSHLGKITHVITILSQTPGAFDSTFARKYKRAIQCFVDRICLEHTLELLKSKAVRGSTVI
jgi:hypothetical protein